MNMKLVPVTMSDEIGRAIRGSEHLPSAMLWEKIMDAVPSLWRPISEAPTLRKVLVAYRNELGNWRRVLAILYTEASPLEASDENGDSDEYDGVGWFEVSETHETWYRVEKEPTYFLDIRDLEYPE